MLNTPQPTPSGKVSGAAGYTAIPRNVDLLVDQIYGLLWYRILVGHAPLTPAQPRS